MKIKLFLVAAIAALFSLTANAGDFSNNTLAVQGYDVVSYHTGKRPVRGSGHFVADHDGATYIFANKENLETFKADPDKYAPAYGGYCAFGVAVGKKFVGDPEVYRVVNDRVYLNLDARVQDKWLEDVPGKIKKADANWEKIRDKSPASL